MIDNISLILGLNWHKSGSRFYDPDDGYNWDFIEHKNYKRDVHNKLDKSFFFNNAINRQKGRSPTDMDYDALAEQDIDDNDLFADDPWGDNK